MVTILYAFRLAFSEIDCKNPSLQNNLSVFTGLTPTGKIRLIHPLKGHASPGHVHLRKWDCLLRLLASLSTQ